MVQDEWNLQLRNCNLTTKIKKVRIRIGKWKITKRPNSEEEIKDLKRKLENEFNQSVPCYAKIQEIKKVEYNILQ